MTLFRPWGGSLFIDNNGPLYLLGLTKKDDPANYAHGFSDGVHAYRAAAHLSRDSSYSRGFKLGSRMRAEVSLLIRDDGTLDTTAVGIEEGLCGAWMTEGASLDYLENHAIGRVAAHLLDVEGPRAKPDRQTWSERDAERYAWLRSGGFFHHAMGSVGPSYATDDEFDALVDKAMARDAIEAEDDDV